ncbi:MAG TPA: universal stress protein [Terracidiphilus sp.]|jgi:nucleotide-binding universal stress UspA family protein|nr:universal stress protein [Terracidiphilus sp.]
MPDSPRNRWTDPSVILVATDLSDLDRLMPHALDQAASTGARLILLHVLALSEAIASDASGMPYYDPGGALDIAAKILSTWCETARKNSIVCDSVVREGNAAQQVLSAARQFHADRILLGTRSRGKVSKLLIGSVAEQVLRSVHIPVITVGPEAHLPAGVNPPQRVVLHATTLRETSRPSAVLAAQIAATLDARLVLLHVLPHLPEMQRRGLPTGLDSAAMQQLRDLAADTAAATALDSTVVIEPKVAHGNPSIEILAESSERNACLIVLGANHRSAFESLTRDRTVYKVLAHARCPVMTLRETLIDDEENIIPRIAMHTQA